MRPEVSLNFHEKRVITCVSEEGDDISPTTQVHAPDSVDVARLIEQIRELLDQEPDDARLAERLGLSLKAVLAIVRLREREGELG